MRRQERRLPSEKELRQKAHELALFKRFCSIKPVNRRPGLTRVHRESASNLYQGLPRTFEVDTRTYDFIEWSELNADR
jgi:hypothetical protein